MNRTKKAVVTGGAGFIGSHLASKLIEKGWRVTILDDLSTGKRENIELLSNQGRIEFIEGSVLNLPRLKEIFQGIDYVFHQAAIPSVPKSIKNPLNSHKVNATGTLNVLIAARDAAIKKVVYASSCAIYGDTPDLIKREEMPADPQSPYAVTKLAGEYYCRVFEQVYGLDTICLRYFNVYGPRQDPDSQYAAVIPIFMKRALEGKAPIIFGDGEQTRDFIFVNDAVEANILAAESQYCGVFNIGGGKSTTIKEVARLILNIAGSDVPPVHQEPRTGDIRHSLADISKAKAFGYKPEYSLEEGLRKTLKDFKH